MSDQRLLLEYLSNRRAGEEIVFSEIRSVLEWSDDAIVGMMEDMGLGKCWVIQKCCERLCHVGSWFSHHKTRMSVKDHSILEALCGSLDEKEDRPSGGAGSGVVDAKHRQSGAARSSDSSAHADSKHFIEERFSAVYKGKARRIAEIKDTRMHQRVEQAFVEWQDGRSDLYFRNVWLAAGQKRMGDAFLVVSLVVFFGGRAHRKRFSQLSGCSLLPAQILTV